MHIQDCFFIKIYFLKILSWFCFFFLYLNNKSNNYYRVGIHMVFAWINCTVTWFLLGYTVRMFEYTVRTFWSNVGRFLYVFSSIPRKWYTIFQPTFSPIKRYQDSIFKLLTLSTNSVTNAHDVSTIRYGASTIQAGSATVASRPPTNVHDLVVVMRQS